MIKIVQIFKQILTSSVFAHTYSSLENWVGQFMNERVL